MSEYGEIETGHESGQLDQLHQEAGSDHDYNSQYGTYGQAEASDKSLDFEQGRHVEYEDPSGAHYEETSYTSFESSESEHNDAFAAEGSESSHASEYFNLDALQSQFDTSFSHGTSLEGGESGLSIASN